MLEVSEVHALSEMRGLGARRRSTGIGCPIPTSFSLRAVPAEAVCADASMTP